MIVQSSTPPPSTSFATLPLPPATLENLQRLGYETMTPIQAASLPLALAGHDLIAQGRTGSGKTAAYALALLANLNQRRFAVQALVLCPTRELADQVTQELRRLARAEDNLKVLTLCGGVTMRPQRASLEHGAHVVVVSLPPSALISPSVDRIWIVAANSLETSSTPAFLFTPPHLHRGQLASVLAEHAFDAKECSVLLGLFVDGHMVASTRGPQLSAQFTAGGSSSALHVCI